MPWRFPTSKLKPTIHFICDHGQKVGVGHIVRCARLSREARRQNSKTTLAISHLDGVKNYHLEAFDSLQTSNELNHSPDMIVLDSYKIDSEYINELRKKTEAAIWLFDNGGRKGFLNVDGIINILPHVTKDLYKGRTPSQCHLLLGPKYAILSEKIESLSLCKSASYRNKDILICMGGGCDSGDLRKLVAPTLSVLNDEHRLLVALSSRASSCRYLIELENKNKERLKIIVDKYDLSETIRRSCLAVVSAGTLAYECNALGTPTILFSRAKNQHKVATGFHEMNGGIYLGRIEEASVDRMKQEIRFHQKFEIRQETIVPPDGAAKIIHAILKLKSAEI